MKHRSLAKERGEGFARRGIKSARKECSGSEFLNLRCTVFGGMFWEFEVNFRKLSSNLRKPGREARDGRGRGSVQIR